MFLNADCHGFEANILGYLEMFKINYTVHYKVIVFVFDISSDTPTSCSPLAHQPSASAQETPLSGKQMLGAQHLCDLVEWTPQVA